MVYLTKLMAPGHGVSNIIRCSAKPGYTTSSIGRKAAASGLSYQPSNPSSPPGSPCQGCQWKIWGRHWRIQPPVSGGGGRGNLERTNLEYPQNWKLHGFNPLFFCGWTQIHFRKRIKNKMKAFWELLGGGGWDMMAPSWALGGGGGAWPGWTPWIRQCGAATPTYEFI